MGTIHPADGLIHRLLKQNAKPSTAANSSEPASSVAIDVTQPVEAAAEEVSQGRERRLESQLLQLYRANRAIKDRES